MSSLYYHDSIHFRRADKSDIQDLLNLKNESWETTHTVTLANYVTQERWIECISGETHCPRYLVLIASSGKNNIGVFKLSDIDWQNRKADAGWDVYKEFRGKGLGKKLVTAGVHFAREVLSLHRLNAQILKNNIASLKCALNAGFIQEGLQKEAILKSGEYIDNLLLGILL